MSKIEISLSPSSIRKAIKELEAKKQSFDEKQKEFVRMFAERIAEYAKNAFDNAEMDISPDGGSRKPDVKVEIEERDGYTAIVAKGSDAVWVEFGAGIYYNGSTGTSPHPKGEELSLTIGSYGKGYGNRNVWGFYDGDELILTHGTPALMPLYNAVKQACEDIKDIAKEVFG